MNPIRTDDQMLTVVQVAQSKKWCLRWVYDQLRAGRIPGALKVGREWRIPRSFLRERKDDSRNDEACQ